MNGRHSMCFRGVEEAEQESERASSASGACDFACREDIASSGQRQGTWLGHLNGVNP